MPYKVKKGFLGQEYTKYYQHIRRKFKAIFLLAEEINQFCHELADKIQPNSKNLQQILVTLLFLRTLETFQGSIILAKKGMVSPCRMLVRCMIDSMSALVKISKDNEFAKTFILSYEYDRKRMLRFAKELDIKQFYQSNPDFDFDQEISKIQTKIEEQKIQKINSEKLLNDSGLFQIYGSAFPILSESVHSTIMDLENTYLELTENNIIKSINYGPKIIDLDKILFTATHIIIKMLESINDLYDLEIKGSIESFSKRLIEIHG